MHDPDQRALRQRIRVGVDAGLLVAAGTDLVAYDLLLLAHAWALKHWYFQLTMDQVDDADARSHSRCAPSSPKAARQYDDC